MTGLFKSFTCELRDLYPHVHTFTKVTVFYDAGELCAQPIRDEFEREWTLKELSIYDLGILTEALTQHLLADAASDACGYADDPWDEFDRAEERVTNAQEEAV